jgi:hypothetical protein
MGFCEVAQKKFEEESRTERPGGAETEGPRENRCQVSEKLLPIYRNSPFSQRESK